MLSILQLVKPFVPFTLEVSTPGRSVNFQEKFIWTSVSLLIYLVASQVPLYGMANEGAADPFYWMRMMMASNRGTLMDLGISPVVTSSMIMQMLVSSGILQVNFGLKEDKVLHDAAQKLIAMIVTIGQAVVQVLSGLYGKPDVLGTRKCVLLIVQLIFSGLIVILLDELLSRGYGIGSGVNLFIATNVCESIAWRSLSPKMYNTARGIEFEGCLIALFHLLITRKNKFNALFEAFTRKNLPNCNSLLFTVLIFAVVIYLQGLRVDVITESTQMKGKTGKYPIKLLYASTMPVIVQGYIIGYSTTISKFLFEKFPKNFFVRLLGVWDKNSAGKTVPIGGFSKFIFPPDSIFEIFSTPVPFVVHVAVSLLGSAFLSRAWIDMNENNHFDVARQLKNNKMTVKGIREQNVASYLERYIPTAAFVGGFCVGLVCLLSNLLDTIGSGTNIFLAVSIVFQYFEAFTKEKMRMQGFYFND